MVPLDPLDSIKRAASDPTLIGREKLLEKRNIDKDSADAIKKDKFWRFKQEIKQKTRNK